MGAAYDDILATAGYGISIFLGVVLSAMYSVKVYIMFSGCSDIGRGISRMLGIKLEKDMGDPFVNPSPVHYLKNFFRGIITFFETCIAAPLTKRFGNSMLVKISASILSSAFMLLLFSVVSDAFVVLVLPLSVAMYSVLFPSEEPEAVETKYKLEKYVLAMLGYVCTFIVMSFAWSFIKVGDLSTVRAYLGVMQNNKMFAVPYETLAVLRDPRYCVIPMIGAAVTMLTSVVMKRCYRLKRDLSTSELIVKGFTQIALAAMFIACIVILLPRFPELSSSEFGRYFL
jgi:D-alanyl-lipoteichoic acid acyltransferase DltB (MBOAT superfamily)